MTAQAPEARSEKRDSIMAKVRKIMDLADGTNVQGEKDAALAQAAALMARYQIEQADVDALKSGTEVEKIIDYAFVIGPEKSPISTSRGRLAMYIAETNRCQMYHGRKVNHDRRDSYGRSAYDYAVHFVGFESDVEFCEMLYTSLALQMDAEYEAAKHEKREWTNGRTFRTNFNAGFVEEAYRRLQMIEVKTADAVHEDDEAKLEDLRIERGDDEPVTFEDSRATSGSLVLVERKQQVDDWVKENLKLRSRSTSGRSTYDGHARGAGRAAAGRADYSAGRTSRIGARGQLGRG